MGPLNFHFPGHICHFVVLFAQLTVTEALTNPLITFVAQLDGKNNHKQHLCNILLSVRDVIEQLNNTILLITIFPRRALRVRFNNKVTNN